jgi:hypothetical protein
LFLDKILFFNLNFFQDFVDFGTTNPNFVVLHKKKEEEKNFLLNHSFIAEEEEEEAAFVVGSFLDVVGVIRLVSKLGFDNGGGSESSTPPPSSTA